MPARVIVATPAGPVPRFDEPEGALLLNFRSATGLTIEARAHVRSSSQKNTEPTVVIMELRLPPEMPAVRLIQLKYGAQEIGQHEPLSRAFLVEIHRTCQSNSLPFHVQPVGEERQRVTTDVTLKKPLPRAKLEDVELWFELTP